MDLGQKVDIMYRKLTSRRIIEMETRNAFTMIELIFVIVVLGILAMVAIPRMSSSINDANIAKARSDVAALRSAIASERQSRFLQGQSNYAEKLDNATTADGQEIFNGDETNTSAGLLLTYPIITGSGDGQWKKVDDTQYTFKNEGVNITFTYYKATTTVSGVVHRAGEFTCNRTASGNEGDFCKRIVD